MGKDPLRQFGVGLFFGVRAVCQKSRIDDKRFEIPLWSSAEGDDVDLWIICEGCDALYTANQQGRMTVDLPRAGVSHHPDGLSVKLLEAQTLGPSGAVKRITLELVDTSDRRR